MSKKSIITIIFMISSLATLAQEELMKELESKDQNETDYAFQTFKGTRLVNGHSIETKGKGTLEFIFAHRFGEVNGGLYELFGLDEAFVRIGLDYGVTDRLSLSIGRNSVDKTADGYAKYKLLRQQKGTSNVPVTMTVLGGIAYRLSPKEAPEGFGNIDRLAYVSQLLIARKFNTKLSLQVAPTLIHKNGAYQSIEENDQLAIGVGGRFKLTRSVALTSEYYHRLNPVDNAPFKNALGFGVDIETGGHVFQLVMTNTRGLTERAFITETTGDFGDGDINFGFNVTRTFQLKKK
ncbi:MAG TPA: DUF5777 family beta-barrel protein [Chryseosolibacter sp.]|nr:DUF5777 family beta-barrel protein [Chryseosolibacter sp.]